MDMQQWLTKLADSALPFIILIGTKLLGAIALWVVGRLLIRGVRAAIRRGGERRNFDKTLIRYLDSATNVMLQILLLVAVLSVFGVATTSFAGVLAAAGVAIGMAWSGLLSNFAAGVFMMILRPIKAGDFVTIGGVTGTVQEIGLFVTSLDTPDNVRTFIGNSKVFGDTIQNYSINSVRRVELTAQLAHGVDPVDAMRRLRARLATIPHVATQPAPEIDLLSFNMAGAVLAVRPYTHTDHYWSVYFATNDAISDEFGKAGYPAPENRHFIRKLG